MDAVELPSQFMENWCWEPEALRLSPVTMKPASRCRRSCWINAGSEKLPGGAVYSAPAGVRLFDFRLHAEFRPDQGAKILELWQKSRNWLPWYRLRHGAVSACFQPHFCRWLCGRLLQLPGADVLAADAFSRFEEEGIFNVKLGNRSSTTF